MMPSKADPRILGPDLAPTPFTADEIRTGCPAGRTIRIRIQLDGHVPTTVINRFIDPDDEGATLESQDLGADGLSVAPMTRTRVTWAELQAHAAFPIDRTSIATAVLETPLGTLDCLRYTVTVVDGARTFWFAKSLPGMPIRYVTEEGGRIVSEVTVVENGVP